METFLVQLPADQKSNLRPQLLKNTLVGDPCGELVGHFRDAVCFGLLVLVLNY